MKMISEFDELQFWTELSAVDADLPFELVAHRSYTKLVSASYSVLFDEVVLHACCNWSRAHLDEPVAAFFTDDDPHGFFRESGYYGGLVFNGQDDPSEVHLALLANQAGNPTLSVYEASYRMFILPASAEWMMIGEREADLALLCFGSEAERLNFFAEAGNLTAFDSLADGAEHARAFMGYPWDPEATRSD